MFPSNETLNIDSDIEIGNTVIISLYFFIIFCGKSKKHRRAPAAQMKQLCFCDGWPIWGFNVCLQRALAQETMGLLWQDQEHLCISLVQLKIFGFGG